MSLPKDPDRDGWHNLPQFWKQSGRQVIQTMPDSPTTTISYAMILWQLVQSVYDPDTGSCHMSWGFRAFGPLYFTLLQNNKYTSITCHSHLSLSREQTDRWHLCPCLSPCHLPRLCHQQVQTPVSMTHYWSCPEMTCVFSSFSPDAASRNTPPGNTAASGRTVTSTTNRELITSQCNLLLPLLLLVYEHIDSGFVDFNKHKMPIHFHVIPQLY